jgi:alpha-ketoglutarate-dependent taurine dioxygenase
MINANIKESSIVIEPMTKAGQTLNIVRPEDGESIGLPDLLFYLRENKDKLEQLLLKTGGILFRGFDIIDREDLIQVKEVFAGTSSFDYVDGNSPRTKLSGDVYTSTEYPKEYPISLHSELSYSNKWPRLIFFFCKIPAAEGGETPIADCRKILAELDPVLVDKFERYGVKYTRYLSGAKGVGKSWMDTFETNDRSIVERYCRENNIDYFWEKDCLSLSQLGTGVAKHPVTGEKVWFNQANQFHPSGLADDIYKALKMMHAKNKHRFPQYAFFGNGEEIEENDLRTITQVHFDYALRFTWQKGDVLMLDNMLMAHGRMPFKGERKILVSMG